ncbi:hypothetical protein Nepgr_030380 [Nepenthes gracilis]|uniref:Uncharacterized protein n=1 Tax=Nepenthes gracilis TaxID=150966 RepID=A0AAD3TFN8_NEPGR|nr:hypothetical protein Nepgr_030380 [Nepenthes gracilis]
MLMDLDKRFISSLFWAPVAMVSQIIGDVTNVTRDLDITCRNEKFKMPHQTLAFPECIIKSTDMLTSPLLQSILAKPKSLEVDNVLL